MLYYRGNVNVVADAIGRFSMGSVAHVEGDKKKKLVSDVHSLLD